MSNAFCYFCAEALIKDRKFYPPRECKGNTRSRWKPSGRNIGYLVENRGEGAE